MNETVWHVRIDADLKRESEELVESMGASLSEAVRIFLKQSILAQQFPCPVRSLTKKGEGAAYGYLNLYAIPVTREQERDAWISSLAKKK